MRRSAAIGFLLLQAVLGPATALAHAAERSTAPAAIESHHSSSCVVVHNDARCPVCGWSLQAPPLEPASVTTSAPAARAPDALATDTPSGAYDPLATAAPRAPPSILL